MDSIKLLFSVIGNIVSYILDLLFFLLIRIYFDIEVIGLYGVIISSIMVFSFLLSFGFETVYITFVSKSNDSDTRAKCNGALLFFKSIQVLAYSFVILIVYSLFPLPDSETYVFLLIFFSFLIGYAANNVLGLYLISIGYIFKKSLSLLIFSFLKIILLISFSIFNSNIWGLASIYLISNLIYLITILLLSRGMIIKRPDLELLKEFLKLAIPLFFVMVLLTISKNLDILMINTFSSIEVVANYYTAKQIYDFFIILLVGISFILLTEFSSNVSSGEVAKNYEIIRRTHRLLNLIVVPMVFIILLYSPEVLVLILGEDYRSSGLYLSIFSLCFLVISLEAANRVQLKALEEYNFLVKMKIFHFSLLVFLTFLFISPNLLNYGAIGGAFAPVIAWIATLVLFGPFLYKKYNLGFYWGSFRNLGIMVAIFILQIYINNQIGYPFYFIPFYILFNMGLYLFFNYLFNGFTKEDVDFFSSIFNYKKIKASISSELKDLNKIMPETK